MGRKKIQIRAIADEKSRLVTFAKRKNGLFKKAYELSVLCECEIALIVFTRSGRLHQYASTTMEHALIRRDAHPSAKEFSNNEDVQKSLRKRSRNSTLSETNATAQNNSTKFRGIPVRSESSTKLTKDRFSKVSPHGLPIRRRSSSKSPLVKPRISLGCVPSSLSPVKVTSQMVPIYPCVFSTGAPTSGSPPGLLFGTSAQNDQRAVSASASSAVLIAPPFDSMSSTPACLPHASLTSVCYPLALTTQSETESPSTSGHFVALQAPCITTAQNFVSPAMILHYAVLERSSAVTDGSTSGNSSNHTASSFRSADPVADTDTDLLCSYENLDNSKRTSVSAVELSTGVLRTSSPVGLNVNCNIGSTVPRDVQHSSSETPDCSQNSTSSTGLTSFPSSIAHAGDGTDIAPVSCNNRSSSTDRDVTTLSGPRSFRRGCYPRLSLLNVTPVNSLQDPNTPSYGVPLMLLPTPEVESELKSLEASSDCGGSLKSLDCPGLNGPIDLSSPVTCSLYPLSDPFSGVIVNRTHIKKENNPTCRTVEENPTDLSLSELVQSMY